MTKPIEPPEDAQRRERYDGKDELIMKNLMSDARRSARQLSLAVGLSTVTVLSRIKRLEKAGVIRGYHASIDHEKVGYGLTVIIEVVVEKNKICHIGESISKHENVCAIYDMTGSADMLIMAKFRSRRELSTFVNDLGDTEYVKSTATHVVLSTIKEDFGLM